MKLLEKIILSKGKQYKVVYTRDISLQDILDCFAWSHRRDYIGINRNLFCKGHPGYQPIEDFLDLVALKAKQWWTPYWLLNLLYLFGKDHSIVRCRNMRLSDWHSILTNGIMIHDIKEKYGTLRIYGTFDNELNMALDKLEALIDPMLEPY